jgi:dCMP deaminase
MRPSREDTLMDIACTVAKRSTCNRLNVGAVLALEARVISMGYNGPPSGINHCQHKNGAPCDDAVHAEANAIMFAARHGIATEFSDLYVTNQPCLRCAQLIINCGVNRVYVKDGYRDPAGRELLIRAGVSYCLKLPDIGGPQWRVMDQ